MNARPRISFVVPAYNEEVLLPACLRAIRAEVERRGVEAEIIVVNNASTDRTAEVAIKEPGVTLVQQPIKGLVWRGAPGSRHRLASWWRISTQTRWCRAAGSTACWPIRRGTPSWWRSAGRTITTTCRSVSARRRGRSTASAS